MSHRFVWSVAAALSLAGVIAWLSQSSAQRPGGVPGGMPGMPGNPQHMPGRFVVANASAHQVLILDTATGQVYRAGERDFKSVSELPGMGRPGGGRDVRPPARDRGPEPKADERPGDGRRPPPKDGEGVGKQREPKDKDEAPQRRSERVKDAPPQREEK